MKPTSIIFSLSTLIALAACSATPVTKEGAIIEITNEKPTGNCSSLGEVAGSQGNWFTGDYTSNKNLMVGARNKLRNEAAKLGGNYVWLQGANNTNAWGSLGTTNTTAIGIVYHCKK